MSNSRSDPNYPPPGAEDDLSDTVIEQHPDDDNYEIVIEVPMCVPSDQQASTSAEAEAVEDQFTPINLAPSRSTMDTENVTITPLPVYPIRKRHVALPVAPMMPRYSMGASYENMPSTSSQLTPFELASSSSSWSGPQAQVNMEARPSGSRSHRTIREFRVNTTADVRPSTSRGHPQWATASTSASITKKRVRSQSHRDSGRVKHRNYPDCILCQATSVCKELCRKDGNLLHMSNCLHAMKLERVWSASIAERLRTPLDVFQESQRNRLTNNPSGSMTARREFLVGPLEYMQAPGEEVEFGEVVPPVEPSNNMIWREDQPE